MDNDDLNDSNGDKYESAKFLIAKINKFSNGEVVLLRRKKSKPNSPICEGKGSTATGDSCNNDNSNDGSYSNSKEFV